LSQAEAVADIIASSSRASHRVAMNQMRGVFSQRIGELRQQLLQFVSLIELELDFSEEDVTFADREKLLSLADKIHGVIKRLAESYATGNVIKNGLPVAIVGQTNAGKSTILNALLHDDKALVSDIQGTTRDVIEDTIVIGGITFRFIDTAGIRHSSDAIEAMGIERTFRKLDQAQIVLWVIDGTEKPQDVAQFLADNIEPHCHGKQLLAVINKADVAPADNIAAITKVIGQLNHIVISAKREADIAMLQQRVTEAAAIPQIDDNAVVVTNARHYEALVRADEALARSVAGLKSGLSGDLVSQDIRECLHYLGEITGEISNNEILGEIFSHFCVGK
jgi:tRNA modification GTPase